MLEALNNLGMHLFISKFFSSSTETFLSSSQFQYENFLKTFLAKNFEFQRFAHECYMESEKFHAHLK